MSYILDSINQIRFPAIEGPFGVYLLIINRPGYTGVTITASQTLQLSQGTDPSFSNRISPYIKQDIPLSKKLTTTVGRRALDDAPIGIRDSIGWSGYIQDAPSTLRSEQFDADFLTFFDVWFTGKAPYQALLQTTNFTPSGNVTNISHIGWVDPQYNPSTDADIINPGTTSQIWIGTRTIKVAAMSQAQISLTLRNVLQPYDAINNPNVPVGYAGITSSDCVSGQCYNGAVTVPLNCANKINTFNDNMTAVRGNRMLACPHWHDSNDGNDPVLVSPPAAIWPATPWVNTLTAQIAAFTTGGVISGYANGDTGTIVGGTVTATWKFRGYDINGNAVIYITNAGSGYTSGTTYATTTTGGGAGLTITVTKVEDGLAYGPSGLLFISIGTLFAKISEAMSLGTFTPATDLKSALDFFLQKSNTTSGHNCFPVSAAPLPLDELYISVNVYFQTHPYDGSLWSNPAGFTPDQAIIDVITGICNFLLDDFNEVYSTLGVETLQLTPMGATAGSVPASWAIIGAPTGEDPSQGATNAIVNNRGDNLKVQCPISDKGQSSNIEIPIRLRRIGTTSGLIPLDTESMTWDTGDVDNAQADSSFQIVRFDSNNVATLNPDCWKGLCYLYWYDSAGTAAVYPSVINPFPKNDGTAGSWAGAFHVVNACYKSGSTPPADLLNAPQGDDYFNSRDYHSVAFAALTLMSGTIQTFQYTGISDDSGSVQAITSGMAGVWRLGKTASQNWRAIQVDQLCKGGTTTIKWQSVGSTDAFPLLTDLAYGPVAGSGGTSSSTGGATSTGGNANTNSGTNIIVVSDTLTGDTNDLNIGSTPGEYLLRLSSAVDGYILTGIVAIQSTELTIVNVGTKEITLKHETGSAAANQFILPFSGPFQLMANGTAYFIYDNITQKWRNAG